MEDPSFFLEGIVKSKDETQDFEGPMSLILMLLSKNRIEIRDIKISDILDQYLDYLAKMQAMDLEIASEFIQMAAHLLYIKTKTLLSSESEVSELQALMDSLEQLKCRDAYAAVREVTAELKSASEQGSLFLTKPPEPAPGLPPDEVCSYEGVELLSALYAVFSRGVKPPDITALGASIPRPMVYSVRDKSREIIDALRRGSCTLSSLFAGCASRGETVAAFVSVLELCSMGSVLIVPENGGYTVSFAGGDVDEIIEKIVE